LIYAEIKNLSFMRYAKINYPGIYSSTACLGTFLNRIS